MPREIVVWHVSFQMLKVNGKIHIGTSGWVYKHWKALFYPGSFGNAEWLSYYAQFFRTVEINGSFYRMPARDTITNWMEQVPGERVTSKNIYVRFHGPFELYASSYTDETLKSFIKKFRNWEKDGHEIWAFFNNDINGYAIANAIRMLELLNG